jgi:hypothetical protein
MSETPKPHARILRAGLRLQVACGLCLVVLMLLILTGVAGITLLIVEPVQDKSMGALERHTVGAVQGMKDWIRLIHEWGGYVALLLAGWAGLEIFRFGRMLRRTEHKDWRRTGLWMPALGLLAGLILMGSVAVQIGAGIATHAYVHMEGAPPMAPAMERQHALTDARAEMEQFASEMVVDMHVRELNYLVALGALMLVAASSSTRRVTREARQAPQPLP